MMISAKRLKAYTTLAAAPGAALGGIVAETYAGSGAGPITAQLQGGGIGSGDAFTAVGLQFQAFADHTSFASNGGFQTAHVDRNSAGRMKFWVVESYSQVISVVASGFDQSNNGYGGWRTADFGSGTSTFMVGTETSGSGCPGFAVEDTASETFVAGWIRFTDDRSRGNVANGDFFTIEAWDFNTGSDFTTSIMMPATGGSAAVPGIGGLAGLAMGAAGLRRKRQRVADRDRVRTRKPTIDSPA